MQKDKNSSILQIASPEQENTKSVSLLTLDDFIRRRVIKNSTRRYYSGCFYSKYRKNWRSTTFRKQLNLATSNLVDLLSQVQKDGEKV